ncbi:unnamed protein product, partial [Staurois parvus]
FHGGKNSKLLLYSIYKAPIVRSALYITKGDRTCDRTIPIQCKTAV